MFWFELGREYKLSLAEIYTVFWTVETLYIDDKVLIIDGVPLTSILKKAPKLWGTIKVFEIEAEFDSSVRISELGDAIKNFLLSKREWKLTYGVNFFWKTGIDQKKFLMNLKQSFKAEWVNSRFLNQNFKNLISAQILWEKLTEKQTDINVVFSWEKTWFGKTIWIQDINAYGKRDFWKTRDMDIGMLPPKLAQIMINISGNSRDENRHIYDPFVWLGTVLIESLVMGNTQVFGSDYNQDMVESTKKNITFIQDIFPVSVEKSEVVFLDARDIQNSSILKNNRIDAIVTEGYLGELFTQRTISRDWILEERKKLEQLYENFFAGLKKIKFQWTIVISFPFWELRGTYIYFDEIYKIIEKYCKTEHLLPYWIEFKHTKFGSLLYKRTSQLVGREIFKLRMK